MKPDVIKTPVSRRALLAAVLGAAATATVAVSTTPAEARPPWGAPPGWSRGRKRGWAKKGGPKWRW